MWKLKKKKKKQKKEKGSNNNSVYFFQDKTQFLVLSFYNSFRKRFLFYFFAVNKLLIRILI